jgi:hypothetical protein
MWLDWPVRQDLWFQTFFVDSAKMASVPEKNGFLTAKAAETPPCVRHGGVANVKMAGVPS